MSLRTMNVLSEWTRAEVAWGEWAVDLEHFRGAPPVLPGMAGSKAAAEQSKHKPDEATINHYLHRPLYSIARGGDWREKVRH